ncbi:MAG: hypothetical protein AB1418_00830 [Pseudomonadota bacterium]
MHAPSIRSTLVTLALACSAGSAWAAWGHSDYVHALAYQQRALEQSAGSKPEFDTIRAFDDTIKEDTGHFARKARRPDDSSDAPERPGARG